MKPCPTVQQHQRQNNGATDLVWLEEHIKTCPTCQQIMVQVKRDLNDAVFKGGGTYVGSPPAEGEHLRA